MTIEAPFNLVYHRKQWLSKNVNTQWGDPIKIDEIHKILARHFLVRKTLTNTIEFNNNFRAIDTDDHTTVSVRGLQALFKAIGLYLSDTDAEILFRYYDAEGHGTLDFQTFLVGLRFNLGMETSEANAIIDKLRLRFEAQDPMATNPKALTEMLIKAGLPATKVDLRAFLNTFRALAPGLCSRSELAFLYSLLASDPQNGVTASTVAALLYLPRNRLAEQAFAKNEQSVAIQRKLGRAIYASMGRTGVMQALNRVDHANCGAVDTRQLSGLLITLGLSREETQIFCEEHADPATGKIGIKQFLELFPVEDYVHFTEEALDHIIARIAIGFKKISPQASNRLAQKLGKGPALEMDLPAFTEFLQTLDIAPPLANTEIEMLFSRLCRLGIYIPTAQTVTFQCLADLMPSEQLAAAQKRELSDKMQDDKYMLELEEKFAVALADPNRQSVGPAGMLRVERAFDRIDQNRTGRMNLAEFTRALNMLSLPSDISSADVATVFRSYDPSGAGEIHYQDFLENMRAIVARRQQEHIEVMRRQVVPDAPPVAELPAFRSAVTHAIYGMGRVSPGTVGLTKVLHRIDRDNNGLLDKREFCLGLQTLGVQLDTPEMEALFDAETKGSPQIHINTFIANVSNGVSLDPESEGPTLLAKLAGIFKARGRGAVERMYGKYNRLMPGKMTLLEFNAACRELGCSALTLSDLDLECLYRIHDTTKEGLSAENFVDCVRGAPAPSCKDYFEGTLAKVLALCYDIENGNGCGTLGVVRALNHYDVDRTRTIRKKDLQCALKDLGVLVSDIEFQSFYTNFADKASGLIYIDDLSMKLRKANQQPPLTMEELQRFLRLIAVAMTERQKGLGGIKAHFDALAEGNTTLGLATFTKAIKEFAQSRMGEYDIERLFDYYSHGGATIMNFSPFLEDVGRFMSQPAKEPTSILLSPLAPNMRTLAPQPPAPSSVVVLAAPADIDGIRRKLWRAFYSKADGGIGTLRLLQVFRVATRGNFRVDQKGFVQAVRGGVRHDGSITDAEVIDLFNFYASMDPHNEPPRDRMTIPPPITIDARAVIQELRFSHDIGLAAEELGDFIDRLRFSLRNRGLKTAKEIASVFEEGCYSSEGKVDLQGFTTVMNKWQGGVFNDLELELLFNHFAEQRRTLPLQTFATIVLGLDQPKPLPPTPLSEEVRISLDKMAGHCARSTAVGGLVGYLRAFRKFDRTGQRRLTRREFADAIRFVGAPISNTELEAVCTAFANNPTKDTICTAEFLDALKASQLLSPSQTTRGAGMVGGDPAKDVLTSLIQYFRDAFGVKGINMIQMNKTFAKFDNGRGGRMDLGRFSDAIYHLLPVTTDVHEENVERLFDCLDTEGNGTVDYRVFLEMLASAPKTERFTEPPQDSFRGGKAMEEYNRVTTQVTSPAAGVIMSSPSPAKTGKRRVPVAPIVEVSGVRRELIQNPTPSEGSLASDQMPSKQELDSAESVAEWLAMLKLGKYLPAFEENEITLDLVPELNEEDLIALGLPMGPRRRVLKAIGEDRNLFSC